MPKFFFSRIAEIWDSNPHLGIKNTIFCIGYFYISNFKVNPVLAFPVRRKYSSRWISRRIYSAPWYRRLLFLRRNRCSAAGHRRQRLQPSPRKRREWSARRKRTPESGWERTGAIQSAPTPTWSGARRRVCAGARNRWRSRSSSHCRNSMATSWPSAKL